MNLTQLEFNFENLHPKDLHLAQMQKQIDAACESMGKVRRKMFKELSVFKGQIDDLQQENARLKHQVLQLSGQKLEWKYWTNDQLFEVCESNRELSKIEAMA